MSKQDIIVAPAQARPRPGVMEQLLDTASLLKSVPEMLSEAIAANEKLSVRIEKEGGAIDVSHTPKTTDKRRQVIFKVESDK